MNNEIFFEQLKTDAYSDPVLYQYYHQLFDKRTIVINDSIDSSLIETAVLPLLEFENDGTNEPINIILNTAGGSVLDSLHLCNIIENLKTPTTIRILGYALSMGFLIACSGKNNPNVTVECYESSVFMYHAGNINLDGTTGQARSFMKFNDKIEDYVEDFIISHTKITKEEYEYYKDQDKWLTAEEALKFAIVDRIIGKSDDKEE